MTSVNMVAHTTQFSMRPLWSTTRYPRRSLMSAGSPSSPSPGRGRWRSSLCAMRSMTPSTARLSSASALSSAAYVGHLPVLSSGSCRDVGPWAILATSPRSARSFVSGYRMRSHARFPKARSRRRHRCTDRPCVWGATLRCICHIEPSRDERKRSNVQVISHTSYSTHCCHLLSLPHLAASINPLLSLLAMSSPVFSYFHRIATYTENPDTSSAFLRYYIAETGQ